MPTGHTTTASSHLHTRTQTGSFSTSETTTTAIEVEERNHRRTGRFRLGGSWRRSQPAARQMFFGIQLDDAYAGKETLVHIVGRKEIFVRSLEFDKHNKNRERLRWDELGTGLFSSHSTPLHTPIQVASSNWRIYVLGPVIFYFCWFIKLTR